MGSEELWVCGWYGSGDRWNDRKGVKYPGGAGQLTGLEWDRRYEVIRNAQAALCREEEFILAGSFAPYLQEMKDDYHYHQRAYNLVGEAVGSAMADYVEAPPVRRERKA